MTEPTPITAENKTANDSSAAHDVDDLEAAYKAIAREPYRFRWAGREWVLPHIGELDFRLQAEIEAVSELTLPEVDDLFRRMFGPDQADDWAQVTQPGPFLTILFERWIKHSGRKPGEEQASNTSSANTGESSRPTSAASTVGSGSPKRSTAKRAPRKAASPRGKSST